MIVYIDKTVGVHGKTFGLMETEELMFADLAVAHQRGNCLLCGDLDSLEWLSKNLDGVYGSLFRKVRNMYSETRAIITAVETVLVLSYGELPQVPSFIEGKYRLVSINQAIDYRLNSQCALVCEHLDDCHFYELMAERYIHFQKLNGIQLSFHHELGGGDSLNSVFQKCVEEDKVPTLCLVDGDIKYGATIAFPNPPAQGETAKKVASTYKQLKEEKNTVCIFDLFCLPLHEAENLIPISVLDSIANSSVPDMLQGVAYLRKLLSANLEKAILFYDFKHGGEKIKGDPAITYWIEIADIINDASFPCLCGKVLKKAIDVMQGNTNDKYNFIANISLDNYLAQFWEVIGLKVFSWGCAHQPIRA